MSEILIVIGMVLAFVAGAYIRKPFEHREKKETRVLQEEEEKNETGKLPIPEQFSNMMNYNGTQQSKKGPP